MRSPLRPRHGLVILGLVAAIHLILMAGVFNPSPHTGGDNAGYITLAFSLVEDGSYRDLHDPDRPPHGKYPPVFPTVLALAMLAGARSWVSFKVLSVAFTAVAVVLAFLWVERRSGPVAAAAVALILAVSDAFLWSSHWILSDPLFVALTLLAVWALDPGSGPDVAGERDPSPPDIEARAWTGEAPPPEPAEGNGPGEAAASQPASGGEGAPPARDGPDGRVPRLPGPGWIALGAGAAGLAYFTRAAGLPLVLAVLVWMAHRKEWRSAAAFGGGFAVLAFVWWLRTPGAGGGEYVSEFWLVDPYRPDLGRTDAGDLLGRVLGNVKSYAGTYFPGGLTGYRGGFIRWAGTLLSAMAAVGWARRLRRGPTVAEIFVPLYFGLILLWPEVWSGDRLALPLYPFILFYGGECLFLLLPGRPALARALAVAAFFAIAAPASWVWRDASRAASACRALVAEEGPFACYGPQVREFAEAAAWSRDHLPPASVVLTRKPRLFYVLTGLEGRVYPLERDPDRFVAGVREAGAGYVLLDHLDNLASYYVAPTVEDRPGAFCSIRGWGDPSRPRTELLGILAEDADLPSTVHAESPDAVVVDVTVCPAEMVVGDVDAPPRDYRSSEVPLLAALDR